MDEFSPLSPSSGSEAGNARWFAEEVQPHEARLRSWLAGRFPQIGDVRDVVQEAYSRLLRARTREGVRSVRAFLFIAAHNAACDACRRQRADVLTFVEDIGKIGVLEDVPDAAETAARNEELKLLAEAMRRLPERCRRVFTLRKLFGLSQREIAAELGISEHTVESQIGKGARQCAAYLRARGVFR